MKVKGLLGDYEMLGQNDRQVDEHPHLRSSSIFFTVRYGEGVGVSDMVKARSFLNTMIEIELEAERYANKNPAKSSDREDEVRDQVDERTPQDAQRRDPLR